MNGVPSPCPEPSTSVQPVEPPPIDFQPETSTSVESPVKSPIPPPVDLPSSPLPQPVDQPFDPIPPPFDPSSSPTPTPVDLPSSPSSQTTKQLQPPLSTSISQPEPPPPLTITPSLPLSISPIYLQSPQSSVLPNLISENSPLQPTSSLSQTLGSTILSKSFVSVLSI